ncbi:MAG TPA: DUF6370 family protein [Puia sp.]|nr:DUF6370 family protein [Puia sp.]
MTIKSLFGILLFAIVFKTTNAQSNKTDISKPDPNKKIQTVELSCGECKFHLKGKSCDLAVRINGKAYFINGANIDSFGDAHAKDGFCKAIRKAEVQGEVVSNRFKVSYIKLLQQSE